MISRAASGLPSYTVPPATGGRSPAATTPFGVVEPGPEQAPFGASSPQPFGASPARPTPPPPTSTPPTRAGAPAYPPGFDPEPTVVVRPATKPARSNPAESAPATQVSAPAYPPGFDPEPTIAVPHQRMHGTVYGTGGYETIDTTMPVSMNPVENSGSLTGHILAQGWRDEVVDRRRGNLKVAIAMLVVLGLLVTVSVVFLLTAGNSFSDWIGGIFS
jgi:hypothetical protein